MMMTGFKKWMLFYVALCFLASPMGVVAAQKKSSTRTQISKKISASKVSAKTKASAKTKSSKRVASAKKNKHIIAANLKGKKTKSSRRVHLTLRNTKQLVAPRVIEPDPVPVYIEEYDGSGALYLASTKALIMNQGTGEVVFAKNTNQAAPIASITKLMTAMVMLDAGQSLAEELFISDDDVDYVKGTRSRLQVGTSLNRGEMLKLALMASENRAASALASNYPGGQRTFIKAMNVKALKLGLTHTRFVDPTGLESGNVSTAEDLANLVQAAYQYTEIRAASTAPSHEVYVDGGENAVNFKNTNGLVRGGEWQIGLSKTGFINEAGRCLVMQAKIAGEQLIIVLLDASGKSSRIGDANRIRKWIEYNSNTAEPIELEPTTTGQAPPQRVKSLVLDKVS